MSILFLNIPRLHQHSALKWEKVQALLSFPKHMHVSDAPPVFGAITERLMDNLPTNQLSSVKSRTGQLANYTTRGQRFFNHEKTILYVHAKRTPTLTLSTTEI